MKNIYLLLLLLIVAFGARAQNGSFYEKSYVSVGVGGLYYLNDGNNFSHRWGYSGECTYGVNIFQRVGFRIQGFADHVYNPIDNPHFYFGAHFDLTLNLMRCFGAIVPRSITSLSLSWDLALWNAIKRQKRVGIWNCSYVRESIIPIASTMIYCCRLRRRQS